MFPQSKSPQDHRILAKIKHLFEWIMLICTSNHNTYVQLWWVHSNSWNTPTKICFILFVFGDIYLRLQGSTSPKKVGTCSNQRNLPQTWPFERTTTTTTTATFSPSWWFQPIWKRLISQIGSFPQVSGWTFQKYLSCHHLGYIYLLFIP